MSLDPALQLAMDERTRWQSFYDDRNRRCPFFVLAPDENLVDWIQQGLVDGQRALDVGCGNARNAIYLAKHGFVVDAVDHSASAAQWARDEVAGAGASVSVHCTSVFDFELQAGSYDLVYDGGCFHHVPPHQRTDYVARVASALAPKGLFGLVCFTPEGGSGYTDEEVYERSSMGWGLGYDEARLRQIWGHAFEIRVLRRMQNQAEGAELFGRDFLWAMLAQRRGGCDAGLRWGPSSAAKLRRSARRLAASGGHSRKKAGPIAAPGQGDATWISCARDDKGVQRTSSSSTSNFSVAFGGITPPAPRAP
jgi:SAM-dependent methyltransferase